MLRFVLILSFCFSFVSFDPINKFEVEAGPDLIPIAGRERVVSCEKTAMYFYGGRLSERDLDRRISICNEKIDNADDSVDNKLMASWYFMRGQAYFLSEQYDQALKDARAGLEILDSKQPTLHYPTPLSLTLLEAAVLYQKGEYKAAYELIKSIENITPRVRTIYSFYNMLEVELDELTQLFPTMYNERVNRNIDPDALMKYGRTHVLFDKNLRAKNIIISSMLMKGAAYYFHSELTSLANVELKLKNYEAAFSISNALLQRQDEAVITDWQKKHYSEIDDFSKLPIKWGGSNNSELKSLSLTLAISALHLDKINLAENLEESFSCKSIQCFEFKRDLSAKLNYTEDADYYNEKVENIKSLTRRVRSGSFNLKALVYHIPSSYYFQDAEKYRKLSLTVKIKHLYKDKYKAEVTSKYPIDSWSYEKLLPPILSLELKKMGIREGILVEKESASDTKSRKLGSSESTLEKVGYTLNFRAYPVGIVTSIPKLIPELFVYN